MSGPENPYAPQTMLQDSSGGISESDSSNLMMDYHNQLNFDSNLNFYTPFPNFQETNNQMNGSYNPSIYQQHNYPPQLVFSPSGSGGASIRQTYPGPNSSLQHSVQFAIPYGNNPSPNNPLANGKNPSPKTSPYRRARTLAGNRAISAPNVASHLNLGQDFTHQLANSTTSPEMNSHTSLSPENSEDGMTMSSSSEDLTTLLMRNNSLSLSDGASAHQQIAGKPKNGEKNRPRNVDNNSSSPHRGRSGSTRTVQEMFLWERMKNPQIQKLSTLFKESQPPTAGQSGFPNPNRRVENADRPSKLRKTASEEQVVNYENYINSLQQNGQYLQSHYSNATPAVIHPTLSSSSSDEQSRPDKRLSNGFNHHDLKDEPDDWETSSGELSQHSDNEYKIENANNRLILKEQPNFLQRKCYANENRYLLPNPMVLGLREETFGGNVREGYATVCLVDNQGNRISDPNVARLESTTGSLTKKFDSNDGTASFSLKLHCYNNLNRFRLLFECEYNMDSGLPQKETIISDPFQVHSNKSIASRCPKMWDILPKEGSANKTTEVWIKGKDFHLKGVVVMVDGREAEILEITPTLVSVRAPARSDILLTRTVELKIWNQFSNKLVNASEAQTFTYLV